MIYHLLRWFTGIVLQKERSLCFDLDNATQCRPGSQTAQQSELVKIVTPNQTDQMLGRTRDWATACNVKLIIYVLIFFLISEVNAVIGQYACRALLFLRLQRLSWQRSEICEEWLQNIQLLQVNILEFYNFLRRNQIVLWLGVTISLQTRRYNHWQLV